MHPYRFHLHRAGISNVWQYDDQVFRFEGGRLLLRGKNGAGKSKALEMMLPFLLDGDTKRLDAGGGGRTTFRWLMSEGATGVNRQGFLWLELRRIDEQDTEHFLTLGAIVRWSSSTAEARLSYFITAARVGVDVHLIENSQPVPIDRLRETLGENALIGSARDYRARVGREVFGITDAGRYRNLVHLLYRLRRPTIGDRIEAGQLTTELSEALPPVDDEVLDSVAHNLDDLETVRTDLGRLEATHGALAELMTAYRGYLRGELRRRVHAVDEALTRLRGQRRRAGEAERQVTRALDAEEQALAEVRRWDRTQRQATAELRALRDSAGYRAVQELGQRRLAVQALQAASRSATAAAAADRRSLNALVERLRAETGRLASAVTQLRDGHRQLRDLATGAGLDIAHIGTVPELRYQGAPDDASLEIVHHGLAEQEFHDHRTHLAAAEHAVRSRRSAVADVATMIDEATVAAATAARTEDERDLLDGQQAEAQVRLGEVTAGLVTTSSRFAAAVHHWFTLPVLAGADLSAARHAVAVEDPMPAETPATLRQAAETAAEPLRSEAEARRDALREEQNKTRAELDSVRAEHRHWRSLTDPSPPRSRFHVPGTVTGTPLFRHIDFAEHLDQRSRAGMEAALESSGLLDAVVAADGAVLDPATGEIVLRTEPAVSGASLRDVLVVVPGAEPVTALLAGIGWGADSTAPSWIAADGRWRLGVAHGVWSKPEAEYVGATNREALRRRRLAELDARIDELSARLTALREQLDAVEQQRRELTEALRTVPDGLDLRQSWTRRDEADKAVQRLVRQVADARRRARELRVHADQRRAATESAAAAHLLPTDRAELTLVDQQLRQLATDLPRQGRNTGQFVAQLSPYRNLLGEHRTAVTRTAESADLATVAAEDHLSAEQELAVLERSLGAEPAEILRQETETEARVRAADQQLPAARRDYEHSRDHRVRTAEIRDQDRLRLTEHEQAALHAGSALPRVLTLPGVRPALDLPADLNIEVATGTPPERIRHLDELAVTLRDALGRPQQDLGENGLHQRYTDVRGRLPGGFDLVWEDRDGVKVVEITDDIGQHPLAAATHRLGAELDQKRSAVAEREHHAFERFLLGELGDALSRQIRSAENLVAAMNTTLAEVRTSHGLGARLVWALRDDSDADTRNAVDLLRTPLELRTRDNNDRLREALARRVEDARRSDPTAGYTVHLRAALDYRSWFSFTVRVTDHARPDRERTLSARTAMSQGEQRVVSYLVLFAAAAAHFTSVGESHPPAPRLILLDDAFAKVDEPTHGRLLGLLVDLDLDAVLTSERLWGCFPEVPSLAIYECLRDPTQPGVATLHFRWDGHRRTVLTT
ncbi:TIGR02680 family protein [Winogradskya humida]|uniref:TIGR02680 family protein n=1 Tax=Winogradskya humida TaxID=113566 RepID=A0ABQ4A7N0_9ACTN|nr:TIGR02680 family protein [Actinoplanes humidus]GIE26877.1 hypothetical protein Ahu01nite_099790 [Actinoplanes humidus]